MGVNWYKHKVTRFANTMKTRAMYFPWPKLKSTTSSVILQNYRIVFKTKSRVYSFEKNFLYTKSVYFQVIGLQIDDA